MIDTADPTLAHVLTHLARLDLILRRAVLQLREQRRGPADEDRGLYLSEDEVDRLLTDELSPADPRAAPAPDVSHPSAFDQALSILVGRAREIEARRPDASRLARLAHGFGLNELERDVLVICLAAEIDLKYERLYAYLQDDVTKKRPTVDLILRLLTGSLEERLAARRVFSAAAPLSHWNLVTVHEDPGARRTVLPARYVKLDERIADYLLGSDEPDDRLRAIQSTEEPEVDGLPPKIAERLDRWTAVWADAWSGPAPVVLLSGPDGTGTRAAARHLGAALNRPVLFLSAAALGGEPAHSEAVALAEREARLSGRLVAWVDLDDRFDPGAPPSPEARAFQRELARGAMPVVLCLRTAPPGIARAFGEREAVRLELPEPDVRERRDRWRESAAAAGLLASDAELDALARRFHLTRAQIRDAAREARAAAWSRDPFDPRPTLADVDAAARGQAQHRLGTLAQKIEPRYRWPDLVLPRPQVALLRLIGATAYHRPTVYDDWGFVRKLSRGKGLLALFAGASGTGKTMAAEVIANDLGLDLYRIDLASVVSKYIGETEKNLERIFGEARGSDAILFFDEADALFGRRTDVRDAHDRYANLETAYLLQRVEEYDGVVILASNLKKNLDDAFIRRLQFIVEFPLPDEPERLEIWRRSFPLETPRADDVDLPFLARKLKLTGGNIRNVVLTAAFLAADEGQAVCMRHLVRGAAHELRKMGKLLVENDFEHHYEHARAEG